MDLRPRPVDGPGEQALAGDRVVRPMSVAGVRGSVRLLASYWTASGCGGLSVAAFATSPQIDRPLLVVLSVTCLVIAAVTALALGASTDWLRRRATLVILPSMVASPALCTAVLPAFGDIGEVAALYVLAPLPAFLYLRRRFAYVILVGAAIGHAGALVAMDVSQAWVHWLPVQMTVVMASVYVGGAGSAADQAALAEHEARRFADELNTTLAARVEEQVAEIARASRLRRFLAPAVAEAVLADEGTLLGAHRREIGVLFCDLRGFTAFAATAEPEDVLQVLSDYYACVGGELDRCGATVGGFAGDGVMAFVNDPVPVADPAVHVVRTAEAVHTAVAPLVLRWQRLGLSLDVGLGVAVGHATLGVVGYEGRSDYTALGTVVNLASRLCGAAAAGEVLLDQRSAAAVEPGRVEELDPLRLKGFGAQVRAYRLTA